MKFKVGDRVKHKVYGDGVVIKVDAADKKIPYRIRFCNGWESWGAVENVSKIKTAKTETIVIFRRGEEVIALDKRTGKRAVAKCSPDDKFDFMVGAKLRFERLTAEEKPKREYLQKFEKGKAYVFREKLHDEILGSSNWTGKVDGKIVRVINETTGIVSGFDVSPRWCEEIELYNGKVVCVKNSAGNEGLYTVGRIYEFKDGVITVDNGVEIDKGDEPFASFEEFNSFSSSEFIEVVE